MADPALPQIMPPTPEEIVALRRIAEAAAEIAECQECMKGLHRVVKDRLLAALTAAGITPRCRR